MGRPFHLVIIGGGATGVLALLKAVTLAKSQGVSIQITILEPASQLGLGRAYSTRTENHLLNVPTRKMSIDLNNPEDFNQWVLDRYPKASDSMAWPFVPRIWFGDYLKEKLSALPQAAFRRLRQSAKAVSKSTQPGAGSFSVTVEDGTSLMADGVLVATGYQEAIDAGVLKGPKSSRVLQPYDPDELGKIGQKNDPENDPKNDERKNEKESVLIIGTGLTAIDVFREIQKRSPQTEIHFLSRRGLFPISHNFTLQAQVSGISDLEKVPPLEIFKKLRLAQRAQKVSWVSVADQVRTQVQKIWRSWEISQRRQFVRHMKPYWENIRHRIPPSVAEELRAYLSAHPDRLLAGRIQSTRADGDALVVSYRDRHSLRLKEGRFNWIVLAHGAELSDALSVSSDLPSVLSSGHLQGLWYVGPASKEQYWEITSIPDIVPQLDQVVGEIIDAAKRKV